MKANGAKPVCSQAHRLWGAKCVYRPRDTGSPLFSVASRHSTEVMEELQKLLPGFPGTSPQTPFLQVTPNMNFVHSLLPVQNLQPRGQLEYKVWGLGGPFPGV